MTGMFSRSMYSQTFSSVQCRSGMDADVRAGLEVGLELVPELRRLIRDVPFHVAVARGEVALLRARGLLVAPHADDHAGVAVCSIEHVLEGVLLERAAAVDARGFARSDT